MPTIMVSSTPVQFDAADYERLKDAPMSCREGQVRAYSPEYGTSTQLARILLGLKPHSRRAVWYRNGDPTDLRRENLQVVNRTDLPGLRAARTRGVADPSASARMRDLSRNPNAKRGGTGFHGVSLHKPTGRFNVRLRVPGSDKTQSFGYFDRAEDAAREYDAVRLRHGLDAVNFPE